MAPGGGDGGNTTRPTAEERCVEDGGSVLPSSPPTVCRPSDRPSVPVQTSRTTVRPSGDIRESRDSSHVIHVIHVNHVSGGGSILSEKSAFSSHLVLRPFVHATAFGHVSQFTRKILSAVRIAKLFGHAEKGGPCFSNARATVGKPSRLDVHEILKRKPNRLAVPTSDSSRSHE